MQKHRKCTCYANQPYAFYYTDLQGQADLQDMFLCSIERAGTEFLSSVAGTEPLWWEAGTEPLWTEAGTEPLWSEAGTELLWSEAGTEPLWSEAGTEPLWTEAGTEPLLSEAGTEPLWLEAPSACKVPLWLEAPSACKEPLWLEAPSACRKPVSWCHMEQLSLGLAVAGRVLQLADRPQRPPLPGSAGKPRQLSQCKISSL